LVFNLEKSFGFTGNDRFFFLFSFEKHLFNFRFNATFRQNIIYLTSSDLQINCYFTTGWHKLRDRTFLFYAKWKCVDNEKQLPTPTLLFMPACFRQLWVTTGPLGRTSGKPRPHATIHIWWHPSTWGSPYWPPSPRPHLGKVSMTRCQV